MNKLVSTNIGNEVSKLALDLLGEGRPDIYVLELSSFQLKRTANLPAAVSVLLNVSPDHLDWHGNFEDYADSKYRIFREARAAGARLVVIDPLRSATAREADWHVRPLPGTDTALALGLMHVIVTAGVHDRDYVERVDAAADPATVHARVWRIVAERLRGRLAKAPQVDDGPEQISVSIGLSMLRPGVMAMAIRLRSPRLSRTVVSPWRSCRVAPATLWPTTWESPWCCGRRLS